MSKLYFQQWIISSGVNGKQVSIVDLLYWVAGDIFLQDVDLSNAFLKLYIFQRDE